MMVEGRLIRGSKPPVDAKESATVGKRFEKPDPGKLA
jgi:hypothetical protein